MTEPNQGKRRHKLMPKDIAAKLPKLGAQDGKGEDAIAYLKLFNPTGRYTLYVTEYDGEDTLFGYCLSPLEPAFDEWGYASLSELAETTVFGSMPAIERDKYWRERPVSEVERD
jgi:hypothetical protein